LILNLFSGLQTAYGNGILQPILQWGPNSNGYWVARSAFLDPSGGPVLYSPEAVRVDSGFPLTAVIRSVQQPDGRFIYTSEFLGKEGASFTTPPIDELPMAVQTLEGYGIRNCSDYPDTRMTAMRSITILSGVTDLAPNWESDDQVTDCGQHTTVINNRTTQSEVDIYYRQ
jgi:hypothetical protein